MMVEDVTSGTTGTGTGTGIVDLERRAERNAKTWAACSSQLHASLRSNLSNSSQVAIDAQVVLQAIT